MLNNLRKRLGRVQRSRFRRGSTNPDKQAARTSRLRFEQLEGRLVLDGGPLVISEFMAINDSGLTDEDGDHSDWIEIYNPSDSPVGLDGWYLTDDASDLTQWRFPGATIEPNDYLLVFASNKDRRDPAGPLHADFKLTGDGEYLGLIRPDGITVADDYAPAFP
ncbi:hypothetical protein LCGC14_2112980, partial [marine sediment metagenome]